MAAPVPSNQTGHLQLDQTIYTKSDTKSTKDTAAVSVSVPPSNDEEVKFIFAKAFRELA